MTKTFLCHSVRKWRALAQLVIFTMDIYAWLRDV